MKTCGKCGEAKELTEFNVRRNGHQSWCRACQKAWYQTNKPAHVANVRRRSKRVRKENYDCWTRRDDGWSRAAAWS